MTATKYVPKMPNQIFAEGFMVADLRAVPYEVNKNSHNTESAFALTVEGERRCFVGITYVKPDPGTGDHTGERYKVTGWQSQVRLFRTKREAYLFVLLYKDTWNWDITWVMTDRMRW